ncbi:tryptophan 7-halogenase [Mesorhizobium sp. VK23B]|uniref:Tryptophan 7-halogenase n=2 Tax=Mesorhizobium dulcispinae TaxID=3072316 RepID=A0ABU4XDL5_9HYPH|nr:FAD-dependent monooxygenase [Mesorhizobium sp. VK23B]MDX8464907.1 tryptophan 7-halogenase [Mesorhizobium sp. VK23B]MDX8472876.1 tryptophan 7-halogenase [Mesorhizobium sp. VK23A]
MLLSKAESLAHRRPAAYDVIVFGGGPAGAAVALALARRGHSVAIFRKRSDVAPPIGETVPPGIARPLAQLGLWDQFRAAGHAEAPGTVVIWGGECPYENDFVFNPYGPSWHLDRAHFDTMLIAAAEAAGAEISDCRVNGCVRQPGAGWNVLIDDNHGGRIVAARWLVDATGRAAWLARRLFAKRYRMDRLVAFVKFARCEVVDESRTLIEACPVGWWYAATLPQRRVVKALFTDADLLPRSASDRVRLWRTTLAATSLISKTSPDPDGASAIHIVAAYSGRLMPCAGRDWLAVGDAAQVYDPLTGQGIAKALTSALRGAEAISASLLQDRFALNDFVSTAAREYEDYAIDQVACYRREQRWSRHEFWKRRNLS